MKQVISGFIYDTDKAEEVWTASYSNPSDFKHWSETLYRTKKGAFFLAGGGGPMSRWRKDTGDGYSGSTGIIPLAEAEALDWCESNGADADLIAETFSELAGEA